jgi:hypothetical protein
MLLTVIKGRFIRGEFTHQPLIYKGCFHFKPEKHNSFALINKFINLSTFLGNIKKQFLD